MRSNIYYCGNKGFNFLTTQRPTPNKWNDPTTIKHPHKIIKVVGGQRDILVLKFNNSVEHYTGSKEMKKFTIKNEQIKDIYSGYFTFLILTKSGKVYSLAEYRDIDYNFDYVDVEIPFKDPEKSSFEELRKVTFFEDNQLVVKSIAMGNKSNYFLCQSGKLYANGSNLRGQIGNGTYVDQQLPVLIRNDVLRVFSGIYSSSFFFTTKDNKLFACGENQIGQLGIGNYEEQNSPQSIPNWKGSDNVDLQVGEYHSLLITKEVGGVFSCGNGICNGHGIDTSNFQQLSTFKKTKARKIEVGELHSLLLTNENELYGWGFNEKTNNSPNNDYSKEEWRIPKKINLPNLIINDDTPLKISCTSSASFIYNPPLFNNLILYQDFKLFFKNQKFADSFLLVVNKNKKIKIPIHKLIIELRTGKKLNFIQRVINEKKYSKKVIILFLNWIYYDKIQINRKNPPITNPLINLFDSLKLTFPPKNSLQDDLLELYNDQDSKDFFILVLKENKKDIAIVKSIENDNSNINKKKEQIQEMEDKKKGAKILKNEKNVDPLTIQKASKDLKIINRNVKNYKNGNIEIVKRKKIDSTSEEKYDQIPVHKLILLIRSGLFRGLFDFSEKEKNLNQIQDYSKKSKQSMEILIKYFYTNKIESQVDIDQQTIIEELKDSIEFYQLNKNSNFINELNKNFKF
ncbi:btk-binding protein-related [Anaeramoeba flamelloides]|uniref:Btk-binding protein-related n=1 Tax=Anaeramoeba flamelloides TaxID=1746091 RepID=A0ABQ8Z3C8_9EUKA|nr:btk-binding protein-related [Anaeramoeba flamelloides]